MIAKLLDKNRMEKIIALLICCSVIELVFFKFSPDLQFQKPPESVSNLASFKAYSDYFLTPNSVMYPRFLGNNLLYELAQMISGIMPSSTDIRLHPLRIAAGLLTPIYFIIGVSRAVFAPKDINWKVFLTYYSIMFLCGSYAFYPYDAPSIAFMSLSLSFLLCEEMVYAFIFFIITGLFRESSFHILIFVGIWALVNQSHPLKTRLLWLSAFFFTFVLEYKGIRFFYPAPISSEGHIIFDLNTIIFGKGLWSLTTLITFPLICLFPICYFVSKNISPLAWKHKFMVINCIMIPFWIFFYRAMNGNISEFRMVWPVVLPFIYGLALLPNHTLEQSN